MSESSPILFPTDFRQHSDVAFEQAKCLASARGCRLIVLHVCNMPDMPYSTCDGMSHHEELKAKLALLSSSEVAIERVFTVADPGPEICRLANEFACDLIVMGVTNKHVSEQFLCGSVHAFVEKNATVALATLCQQQQETAAM